MFCIFPAIALPHAFTLEATEKGLCNFTFLDVFRTFGDLGTFGNLLTLTYRNLFE